MTMPATRTCKFPGCARPVEPAVGPGRPGEYCDDLEHTPLKAWRARRAGAAQAVAEPDDLGRPVAMAAARAGMLRDDLLRTVGDLSSQLDRVLGELRTLTDPDAAAAQIETVAAEAGEQVAAAEVRANRAETAARKAEAERDEANAAAGELDTQLQAVTAVQAGSETAREQAVTELAAASRRVAALTAELEQVAGERDQHAARASDLDRDLQSTREQLDLVKASSARADAELAAVNARLVDVEARAGRAEQARSDAERELTAAGKAIARMEAQLEQAHAQTTALTTERLELTAKLATVTERAIRAESTTATPPAGRRGRAARDGDAGTSTD